jgi:hypothetical protein
MNPATASHRPYQLPPDRFGSAFVHQHAGNAGKAARREPREKASFTREWILAMAAALIIVTLVIAAKSVRFFLLHPGATGQ